MTDARVYDDWQLEAIERVTGRCCAIGNRRAMMETLDERGHPIIYDIAGLPTTLFTYDGTRDGFQRAYLVWARANEETESPF